MNTELYRKLFEQIGLPCGRMVCFSKSLYRTKFPNNRVIFNSNIISKEVDGKIWFGDIDLDDPPTREKLNALVLSVGEFCVVSEQDGRFENDAIKYKDAADKAVEVFKISETLK